MKKGSTVFLKFVLCLMGLIALLIAIFGVPSLSPVNVSGHLYVIPTTYLFMAGLYLSLIPFFVLLSQAWKLLTLIDQNAAFTQASVNAYKTIKQCAIAISILLATVLPFIYVGEGMDENPGMIFIALAFAAAPLVVAVFAALLQKVFQNAIDIKSENDLTV